MVTNGGLREQEVRQNLKPSSQGKTAQDSDGRPDTVSERLTAVSCQYGTSTLGPWGAPSWARYLRDSGMGPEAGQSDMQPNFPPSSLQGNSCRHLYHQREGGVRNLFRGRSERLTNVMTATAGKE